MVLDAAVVLAELRGACSCGRLATPTKPQLECAASMPRGASNQNAEAYGRHPSTETRTQLRNCSEHKITVKELSRAHLLLIRVRSTQPSVGLLALANKWLFVSGRGALNSPCFLFGLRHFKEVACRSGTLGLLSAALYPFGCAISWK